MKLEIAQMQNNQELLEFFRSFPLEGNINIKMDRGRDFFKYYSLQSDQFMCYILRDDVDNKILGVVSFVIEQVQIEGKTKTIAWARDLRISPERKAILGWTEHIQPVFSEIKKTFGVEYFFSTLNMSEIKALNTFIRPRSQKRILPKYYLYRRMSLVSVHGHFPWNQSTINTMRIKRGSEKLKDAILEYINKKTKNYSMSGVFNSSTEFSNKIERWYQFNWNDFFIAYDSTDTIVGVISSWTSSGIQDFIPMRYSLEAHNFRQFLKFGNILNWSRKLTKPYHRLKFEASLNFRFLNYIYVDHPDVFNSLLHTVFNEAKDNEFLIYFHDKKNISLKPPKGWISAEQNYGLYCIVLPDEETPDFLHPSHEGFVDTEATRII